MGPSKSFVEVSQVLVLHGLTDVEIEEEHYALVKIVQQFQRSSEVLLALQLLARSATFRLFCLCHQCHPTFMPGSGPTMKIELDPGFQMMEIMRDQLAH